MPQTVTVTPATQRTRPEPGDVLVDVFSGEPAYLVGKQYRTEERVWFDLKRNVIFVNGEVPEELRGTSLKILPPGTRVVIET